MKPPPRKRNRITKDATHEKSPPTKQRGWAQFEQKRLISALETLSRNTQPWKNAGDPDSSMLAEAVRTRTASEVKTYVESLMDELVSVASALKNTSRWGRKNRKPIELWTRMASRVAGDLEAPITAAFSKMLIVCSTEPLCQSNSVLPKVSRPVGTGGSPVGCSVPLSQIVCPLAKGTYAGLSTSFPPLVILTPPRTVVPTTALPVSPQVMQVSNIYPGKQTVLSTATPPRPSMVVPFTPPLPPSSPAVGPTLAQSTPPSPSALPTSDSSVDGNIGVKEDVDFERIYQYLGMTCKPNKGCKLTPMESAILLDLLMSLPEELSLLDCDQLKKHLVPVYQCLSSNAGSERSQAFINELKLKKQTAMRSQLPVEGAECPSSEDQNMHQTPQEPNCLSSQQTSSQPVEAETHPREEWVGLCPPLNPFMVPLKLLRRK